jgi:hypothetical protein
MARIEPFRPPMSRPGYWGGQYAASRKEGRNMTKYLTHSALVVLLALAASATPESPLREQSNVAVAVAAQSFAEQPAVAASTSSERVSRVTEGVAVKPLSSGSGECVSACDEELRACFQHLPKPYCLREYRECVRGCDNDND